MNFPVIHPIKLRDLVDIGQRLGHFIQVGPPKRQFGTPGGDTAPTASQWDDVDRQLFFHFPDERLFFAFARFNRAAWQAQFSRCGDPLAAADCQQFVSPQHHADNAAFAFYKWFGAIHGDNATLGLVSLLAADTKNVTSDFDFEDSQCRVYLLFDFSLPCAADALAVVRRLQSAGFIAYLAGGCVRDGLLGRQPKDFDVATNATPETIRQTFGHRRTLAFGASFGVIGVLGTGQEPTEVATFRSDGTYSDGRRPDQVHFGSAEQDALRRDYTINGLFYDPVQDCVIDFVEGRVDLANRVVRAIGDPYLRIAEDKLRMLRAVRFAATLGFSIDHATTDAIRQLADQVIVTSGERIGAELQRMLGTRGAPIAIELLADTHLLDVIWPGISPDRPRLERAVRLAGAVQPPEFTACVAAILAANAVQPSDMLERLSTRWKMSCDQRAAIEQAIEHRDTLLGADASPWSVIQPLLTLRHRDTLLAAAEAWTLAEQLPRRGIDFCRNRIAQMSPEQLDPPPLLTGQDLIGHGYQPGPAFKPTLAAVRAAQLDGEIASRSDALLLATRLFQQA